MLHLPEPRPPLIAPPPMMTQEECRRAMPLLYTSLFDDEGGQPPGPGPEPSNGGFWPLDNVSNYSDKTGNFADAAPVAGGSIAAVATFPRGYGFLSSGVTSNVNQLAYTQCPLGNIGGDDWTIDLWVKADDFNGGGSSALNLLSIGTAGTANSIVIDQMRQAATPDGFRFALRDSVNALDGGGMVGGTSNPMTVFLSLCRKADRCYTYVGGTLVQDSSVAGQVYDFSGKTMRNFGGTARNNAAIGELRFSLYAQYDGSNFTPPIAPLPDP